MIASTIDLKNVGVQRAGQWILRDVTWTVPAGGCVAILGPNGSGKSTLTRVMSGYIFPTTGEVAVTGQRFGETDLNALRRNVRLVQPAGPYDVMPELTGREVVLTGRTGTIGLFDEPAAAEVEHADALLRRVGLSAVVDRRYETMSSGERVRCLMARALFHKPSLLLLDEPTAGLDLLARERVLATVQSLQRQSPDVTVVMITHHVEELLPATSAVLLMDDGGPAAIGRPEDVLTSENLSRVYRCPLRVERHDGRFYTRVEPGAWEGLLEQ